MIHIEDREGVRAVTLNRPPANSLSLELLRGLEKAAKDAAADPAVRSVLLRSSLPKYFSAGLDAEDLVGPEGTARQEPFNALLDAYRAWLELPKPTLAVVEGYALLGGCIVAMACDFRFLARETGRMSLSEVKLGLSPTPVLLARLLAIGVTPGAARQLALKGRTLRAEEALAAGLADRVFPAAELAGESWAEAKTLARLPSGAYGAVKRHLARASGPEFEALWRESVAEFPRLVALPEAREALGALAKRVTGAASGAGE